MRSTDCPRARTRVLVTVDPVMGMSMTRTPLLPSNSRSRRPLASSHIPVTSTTLSSCRAASSAARPAPPGRCQTHSVSTTGTGASGLSRVADPSKSMSSITSPTMTSGWVLMKPALPEAHCRLPCRANGPAADAPLARWPSWRHRHRWRRDRCWPADWAHGRSAPTSPCPRRGRP